MPLRRRVTGIAAFACAAAGVIAATSAAAATGDPTKATLSGQWVLTATVTRYTSTTHLFTTYPVGHTARVTVGFTEVCAASGNCTLTITLPPSANGISNFDNATGLAFPQGPVPFTNGSLSTNPPPGGFGGPNLPPCNPPMPIYSLTLTVTHAVRDTSGDHADTVTGTQQALDSWTCGASGAIGQYQIIDLIGHPVGYIAPTPTPAPSPSHAPAAVAATPPPSEGTFTHPRPNTITSGIAPPSDVFGSPASIAINAAVTVAVLLFITFPANLFNRTLDENYDEIMGMIERRAPWLARWRRAAQQPSHVQRRHLIVFLVVLFAGAILGGFLDPHFGFNGPSFTTLMSTLLSIAFGLLVGTSLSAGYRKLRGRGLEMTPRALPAGLFIAAFCVVISRLTDFHPGYLYGVICGIAFTAPIPQREEAHLVALGAITTLVLAVIAWFIWVPLHNAAANPTAGFGTVLADDFVGALFVGGLVGSVIGLFPLRFLPGATLAQWSRAIWAATFGIAVFGFLQLMLRPESSSAHSTKAAVVTAIILFVVFGVASVLFRYYFYRRHRRLAAAPAS